MLLSSVGRFSVELRWRVPGCRHVAQGARFGFCDCVCLEGILTAGLLEWIHPKADHVLQGSSLAGVHPNALFILERYPKSI